MWILQSQVLVSQSMFAVATSNVSRVCKTGPLEFAAPALPLQPLRVKDCRPESLEVAIYVLPLHLQRIVEVAVPFHPLHPLLLCLLFFARPTLAGQDRIKVFSSRR